MVPKHNISPPISFVERSESVIIPNYKYAEDRILSDLKEYVDKTYSGHYHTDQLDQENDLTCLDAWIAMGDASSSFRNTAMKYLWRYGKKNGHNKEDLLKAIHYMMFLLYNDHYRGKSKE